MEELDSATLASYMSDAIHPNAKGYEWMASVFTEYLSECYTANHPGETIKK